VRALVRRLWSNDHRQSDHRNPTDYRSSSCRPLRPWQVRDRLFTPRGRHGLDAAEVHKFLGRVAGDLEILYAELARSRDENWRIKEKLREWQRA
jgi:DivIVA domain-containing protein